MTVPELLQDARTAILRAEGRWSVNDAEIAADCVRTALHRLQQAQAIMLSSTWPTT